MMASTRTIAIVAAGAALAVGATPAMAAPRFTARVSNPYFPLLKA